MTFTLPDLPAGPSPAVTNMILSAAVAAGAVTALFDPAVERRVMDSRLCHAALAALPRRWEDAPRPLALAGAPAVYLAAALLVPVPNPGPFVAVALVMHALLAGHYLRLVRAVRRHQDGGGR